MPIKFFVLEWIDLDCFWGGGLKKETKEEASRLVVNLEIKINACSLLILVGAIGCAIVHTMVLCVPTS